MALDFANAGQLPKAPVQYNVEYFNQLVRVLEVYFSQLDSQMWNHAERYTAKQFVGGDFHGGRFFGDGFYLKEETQRFTSSLTQASSAPAGTANVVTLDSAGLTSSITLVAPGRMTVSQPGLYEVTYYLQFNNSSLQTNVLVWLRVNGVDRANSAVRYTVPASGWLKAVFSYVPKLVAGDYLELAWTPNVNTISLIANAALAAVPGTTPAIPAMPSVVVNMSLIQADVPADAVLRLPHRLRNV